MEQQVEERTAEWGGMRTVLVIEDNELNREILTALLSDHYRVLQAENGQAGLEVVQQHYQELSVILLDVQMPVMNGYEFLKRIKIDPLLSVIPVIVTTGSSGQQEEEKCLKLGASDFVAKPYNNSIVLSRIQNIIRLRESAVALSAIEFDDLTELYTKQAFYHHAGNLLKQHPDTDYTLIVSNIDDFKSVNRKYGEETGNRVLQIGAKYLKPAMKYGALVGRYNGDQFVSMMETRKDLDPNQILKEMIPRIEAESEVTGLQLRLGIYEKVDHTLPVSTLCERALMAARSVYHQYGRMYAYYDHTLEEQNERRQLLESLMRQAYDEGQFQVYYQPKHDTQTGELVGAEALIRWIHPQLGFLSPGEFIPLFERNGFISYADYYVWKRTCRNLREWMDQGIQVVPVSVNASKKDFDNWDYISYLKKPVEEYRIDPALLHVEVTESIFSEDPARLTAQLKELQDIGFKIELDDFGSGYSSLNMLGTLPLDVLKLDMVFMRQVENEKKAKVLASSVALARSLGMKTLSEGVETIEQVHLLQSLHCDIIQGYYFSRPLPEDQFEAYMKEYQKRRQEGKLEKPSSQNPDETGIYLVDEDYRVVSYNEIIGSLYPTMKVGEKCHHCLMNLDHPCPLCPIENRIVGPKVYLDPIRKCYETVQVADLPMPDGKKGHAVVLYTIPTQDLPE